MKVLNEPDLSPNNGLENVSQINQSMASKPPSQGQAKDLTSHDNRARRVMTPVPSCASSFCASAAPLCAKLLSTIGSSSFLVSFCQYKCWISLAVHAYTLESFNLPFRPALGLHDAFRHLHPEAREFTYTAANDSSSVRADRWLINDSLLYTNNTASVTDLILPDYSGVATSVSAANAPPADPSCLLSSFLSLPLRPSRQLESGLSFMPIQGT